MKNKNNILVRIWRAIFCVDYIENYDVIKRKAEEAPVAPKEVEPIVLMSTEYDTEVTGKIVGEKYASWRLYDSWPAHVVNGDLAPKVVLKMNARAFMFHVSVWATVNEKNVRDLCISIRETLDPNTYNRWYTGILLLPEGEEADAFHTWWNDYVQRVGFDKALLDTAEQGIFPQLNIGDMISGSVCTHRGMHYSERIEAWNPEKQLFDQWCWIVEKCQGKVWVTPSHFIFEEPTDAVLYKLSNVDQEEK